LANEEQTTSDIVEEIEDEDGVENEKADRQKTVFNDLESERLKKPETLPRMNRSATG